MSKRAIYLGGKRSAAAASDGSTTWTSDATDDWHVADPNDGANGGGYTANPGTASATIGCEAGEMEMEPGSFHIYAMMWTLPSGIVAATTISSASLTIKTHSSGVDSGVDMYIGVDVDPSTTHPSNIAEAVTKSDRDSGTTPTTAPTNWSWVIAGLVTPSTRPGIAANTSYEINVAGQINAIIGRSGWDAGGRSMTLLLSGPVEDNGMGAWVASGDDRTTIKTVADTADEPSLTIVYSN